MAAGRPSKYDPKCLKQVQKLCALGATDNDVADFLEVDVATIMRWKVRYPEFCEALKLGKDPADDRVEQSLYRRATGYSYDTEKLFVIDGVIHRVPFTEHIPPSVTACIFWLKNRRSATWRDKREDDDKAEVHVHLHNQ